MIINTEWLEKQDIDPDTGEKADPYVAGIVQWGRKILDLLEALPESEPIDADAIVHQANREAEIHGTGNMAAFAALIATKCHSRGEEFRKSWNVANGNPESEGVVNPAIVTIK